MGLAPNKLSAEQSCDSARWYVVVTKSREETKAQLNLERRGYGVFLPQLRLRKRRKGKWEVVTESLFPSYLFVFFEAGKDDPAPIRSPVGCIHLVRFGHAYTPVPADLIAGLGVVAANYDPVLPSFQSGDAVRLMPGPFAGLEGVYDMAKGKDWAQVLFEVLGGVQRLTVDMFTLT